MTSPAPLEARVRTMPMHEAEKFVNNVLGNIFSEIIDNPLTNYGNLDRWEGIEARVTERLRSRVESAVTNVSAFYPDDVERLAALQEYLTTAVPKYISDAKEANSRTVGLKDRNSDVPYAVRVVDYVKENAKCLAGIAAVTITATLSPSIVSEVLHGGYEGAHSGWFWGNSGVIGAVGFLFSSSVLLIKAAIESNKKIHMKHDVYRKIMDNAANDAIAAFTSVR